MILIKNLRNERFRHRPTEMAKKRFKIKYISDADKTLLFRFTEDTSLLIHYICAELQAKQPILGKSIQITQILRHSVG